MDDLASWLNSNDLRVTAYMLGAALCAVACVRLYTGGARRSSVAFWAGLTLIMFVLGLSRIVDLGPLLTDHGRDFARDQGWYEDRRSVQRTVVEVVLMAGAIGGAIGLIWLALAASREYPLAALAIVYLGTYVLIRAVSLHHIDQLLYNRPIEGVRLNAIFELGGIAVLCVAAALSLAIRPRTLEARPA